MTVFSKAPVRIDFAGGWSDVRDFAHGEGGRVVNAAVSLHTRVECLVGGGAIRIHAEDLGERLVVSGPAGLAYDGRLDLHKAALNMLPVSGGIEIITTSDVPAGSGLGGSGSLDVALLAALAHCRGESYGPTELAELAFYLETEELRLLGGMQDQYGAALGGLNDLQVDAAGVRARPLTLSPAAAADLRGCLHIVYTGQSHFSSRTHERVWQAFHAGDQDVTDAIRTMRDLAGEAAGALERADWRALADAVDANWTQQQRLDATISTEGTQRIERAVRDAGAWGLKATGAGAGGCLIVLAPPDRGGAVREAAGRAGGRLLDWTFDFDGVTVWERETRSRGDGAGWSP